MKLAVIGANGKAGQLIVQEAVNRGYDVTAVVRGENKSAAQHVLQKGLFSLTKEDLAPFDVVISAFAAWTPETLPQHSTSLMHLSDLLSGTDKRLLVVGGAGSLFVDKEHKVRLSDTPDFPDAYKPIAGAMAEGLDLLRKREDVKWTYVSPAAEFVAGGPRTGSYLLGGEEFFVNDEGQSLISYADYAIAMVDEATRGHFIQERISVIGE